MPKICHIVLWKLKEGVTAQAAKSSVDALIKLKAPGRLSCVITPTVGPTDRLHGFELGMYSTFESMDALNKYAVSEEHVNCVNENVKPYVASPLAYDWEIPE